MNILVVEDDHLQANWIRSSLEEGFPGATIQQISTEHEFHSRFNEIVVDPPDVVVMDVMLRWADPIPHLEPPPKEVQDEGFYRAGLRCKKMLAQDDRTANVPVILYTVLEYVDLEIDLRDSPSNVTHLRKEANSEELFDRIRRSIL
jgi:CheY-like chemotaxis protein